MCEPATIIATIGLGLEVASAVSGNQAQKKQAKAIGKAADNSAAIDTQTISLRQVQEKDAAGQTIMQADRSARMADATARVSAGESGVSGASVDALLSDLQNQDSAFKVQTGRNLDATLDQLDREKLGVAATAANRKAGAPFPSDFATGLQIAGAGVDFAAGLIARRPKAGH